MEFDAALLNISKLKSDLEDKFAFHTLIIYKVWTEVDFNDGSIYSLCENMQPFKIIL